VFKEPLGVYCVMVQDFLNSWIKKLVGWKIDLSDEYSGILLRLVLMVGVYSFGMGAENHAA